MKRYVFLPIVIALASCSSSKDGLTQTSVYVLPDGRIKVGDVIGEPEATLKYLGSPATTMVAFSVCPATDFRKFHKAFVVFEKAGYRRGFAPVSDSDPVCAKR